MIYDVAVVGAGASGMMAGICALRRNRSVVIIDALKVPGKKLKATGNGKCNYTNRNMDPGLYHGHHRDFIEYVLGRFGNRECEEFFMDLGVLPVEKNGYVYPANGSAQYFTELLFGHLKREGAVFEPGLTVTKIEKFRDRFYLTTSGKPVEAKKV
ncbi:MAG: NAD(P)/FAD-dependent oxidoreductase, partial [Lachnospiraceae bacterium]|nr:NAD(P)/FAD-dependent oxidoreductase [Lachnospiraceae bacterium]